MIGTFRPAPRPRLPRTRRGPEIDLVNLDDAADKWPGFGLGQSHHPLPHRRKPMGGVLVDAAPAGKSCAKQRSNRPKIPFQMRARHKYLFCIAVLVFQQAHPPSTRKDPYKNALVGRC